MNIRKFHLICLFFFFVSASLFAQSNTTSADQVQGTLPSIEQIRAMKHKILTPGPTGIETAELYSNGPLWNNSAPPAPIPAGAYGSELSSGYNWLGGGWQFTAGNSLADDFTSDAEWNIDSLVFYGYQIGSGTTSSYTAIYVQIWNGPPDAAGSSIVWGDFTTNVMGSTHFTNIYRYTDTSPSVERPIMAIVVTPAGLHLPAGTYWIHTTAEGSGASGPWMPPTAYTGAPYNGNSKQLISSGWMQWVDAGAAGDNLEIPFRIFGTAGAPAGPGLATDPSPADGSTLIGITGISLSWTNSAPTALVDLYFSSNAALVQALDPSVRVSSGSLINSFPITNLIHSTTYYWRVVGIDGTGSTRNPVWSFRSMRDPSMWFEDFEAGLGNWTVTNTGVSCVWGIDVVSNPDYAMPPTAAGIVAVANADACGSGGPWPMSTWLTLNTGVNLSAYADATLEFDMDFNQLDIDTGLVEISPDGGATWETVARYTADTRTAHQVYDVSAIAAGSSNVRIRFHYFANDWNWAFAIDNVMLYGTLLSGPHFSTVWETPYMPMNIFVTKAALLGVDLEPGDEIAVYDGNVCVAAGVLTQSLVSPEYLSLVASMDDPTTPAVDGFTSANSMSFKIWDDGSSIEYSNISAQFTTGSAVFSPLGTSIVNLNYMGNNIIVSVPNLIAAPGQVVSVPVLLENFNNLGAITLTLTFDTAVLSYIDAVNWSPLIPDALANESNGQIVIAWDAVQSISGTSEKLVDLQFNFTGDTTDITFLPEESELSDAASVPLPVVYLNGSVCESHGENLSGAVNYRNAALTPIIGANVLLLQNGSPIDSMITSNTGAFLFTQVFPGTYPLVVKHRAPWAGVNSTDALQLRRYVVNLQTFDSLQIKAADVNRSNTVNSTDALLIRRRVVRIDTTFVRGDWAFETPTVPVTGGNTIQNILGLCTGDVNGSNTPGVLKATPTVNLLTKGTLETQEGKDFNIPVHISTSEAIGAVTLLFEYPEESMGIKGITSKMEGMLFSAKDGILTIAWDDIAGVTFTENEPLFTILAADKKNESKERSFSLIAEFSEIADIEANVLSGVTVTMPEIGAALPTEFALSQNYPNPFNPSTTIQYDIPTNAHVRIEIFNTLGEVVEVLSDAVQAPGRYTAVWNAKNFTTGVYFYRMTAESSTKNYTQVKKLMLVK